jgi:hypothetical protein
MSNVALSINRRVATADDVRALASEPESETLDYKEVADEDEWWELAKDIAAFANHLGGVLLVGAKEQPDGLPKLHGLPPAKVAKLKHAYEMAARDKCRPAALVTCEVIPWDGGRKMLAVNVSAYTGGLVGAQFYALSKAKKPEPANAWQFPMRVAKHNPPLPLEQAIMHMSILARRVAILLASIPDRSKVAIAWHRPDQPRHPWPAFKATLTGVSVERNVASFTLDGEAIIVPLDDIDAVWEGDGGRWSVRVSGFFDSSNGKQTYQSRPRSYS